METRGSASERQNVQGRGRAADAERDREAEPKPGQHSRAPRKNLNNLGAFLPGNSQGTTGADQGLSPAFAPMPADPAQPQQGIRASTRGSTICGPHPSAAGRRR